jgi:prephenate dehydrogenase
MLAHLALIGTGHIGGSLLLALRAQGRVDRAVGYDRDASVARRALALGIIDEIAGDAAEAAEGAALVVLATPVAAIVETARAIAPRLGAACLVTDVGSVKSLVGEVERALPYPERYVGSHPIAGSERSGPEAACATLFLGRPCVVTPTARTAPDAVDEIAALWEAVGARVERLDPLRHDAVVAATSHLPHVAAFALAAALERPLDPVAPHLAGDSLRDGTRVAASEPATWVDILAANRAALLPLVDALGAELAAIRAAIAAGDKGALRSCLERARRGRARVVEAG